MTIWKKDTHTPLREQRQRSREAPRPEDLQPPTITDIQELIGKMNVALCKFILRIPWAPGAKEILPGNVWMEVSSIPLDGKTWDVYMKLIVDKSLERELEGMRVKLIHTLSPEKSPETASLDAYGIGIIKSVPGLQPVKPQPQPTLRPGIPPEDPREPYRIEFEPAPPVPSHRKPPTGMTAA